MEEEGKDTARIREHLDKMVLVEGGTRAKRTGGKNS